MQEQFVDILIQKGVKKIIIDKVTSKNNKTFYAHGNKEKLLEIIDVLRKYDISDNAIFGCLTLLHEGNVSEIEKKLKVLYNHGITKQTIEQSIIVLAKGKANEIEKIFEVLEKHNITKQTIEQSLSVLSRGKANEIEKIFEVLYAHNISKESIERCLYVFAMGKASKIEQDNYYLKVTSYSSEVANSSEYYIKDEKYIGKMVRHDLSENTFFKITTYHTDEESLQLTEFGDRKVILSNKLDAMISPISFTSKNFFINFCIALSTSIDKVNLAGRECYIIKDGNTQKFIDIDTGLAIKMIDIENNMTVDYHYEYGVVKDSDIVRPDTSGYELEI